MFKSYSQYIITDSEDLESNLVDFEKQLHSRFILLEDAFNSPEQIQSKAKFQKIIFYLKEKTLRENFEKIQNFIKANPAFLPLFILNAPIGNNIPAELEMDNDLYYTDIEETVPKLFIVKNFLNAFTTLSLRMDSFELQYKVNLSSSHIAKLTRIGVSLANEKDYTKLLRDILYSSREICIADAGSLYLVDNDEKGNPKNLRFKISALDLNSSEFILPINKESVAGYVAATGQVLNIPDAYHLPPNAEYKFNSEYDRIKNYYTKSMLVVPMKNHSGQTIGVIQLINKKKYFHQKLTIEQMKTEVSSFDKYSEELVMSVAGQAAMAILNNILIQDIEKLFEGFVTASVSAIEARDPTTSGHSFRVAELTVGLAETVDRIDSGIYSPIKFSYEQLKEIRYASLLHDFGKVGVREKVLVKSKKLEQYEIDIIKWRFYYIQKEIELRLNEKKINYLKNSGSAGFAEYEKAIQLEYDIERKRLDDLLMTVIKCNEPTILEESSSQVLEDIAKIQYLSGTGVYEPLLTSQELNFLSIKKGSLDFEERKEIESHVEHTYQFLSKIPWTSALKMVPSIAHAHHEKLNGGGYPRGLISSEIPIQSKMMTIADIYDALTDKDRPYKKAVPLERALDILKMEVKDNHVDSELLNIFIESKIYERLNKTSIQQK
ncbi:MAG: HD domain-containing phosphohydrolase [Leptospiraceae bacterium]|nr:HD domain-containing phosphohydrolase [Leptospiraceae bacterium]